MNKVFNINLGGYPFTIDEGAYEHLSTYLKTIHNHFRQSDGYEEITSDIEARLAEIFRENLGERPIVSLHHVEDAIAIMGTPEDFGAEPVEEGEAEQAAPESEQPDSAASDKERSYRTGKRLFRNPEDEKLAGVCSGIASYFGIQDPLWVRLAFVLFTISGGFGILIYIILWAVLPKAETASDRLSMRGEPINVSNIGKIIEEEMEHFSHKMAEFGGEWGDSWGSKKKRSENAGRVHEVLEKIISTLSKVISIFFKILMNIWKPILFFVMVALLLAFAASWIGAIIGLTFAYPFMSYLTPGSTFLPMLGVVGLMLTIGIPVLMTAFGIGKRLFRFRMNPYVRAGVGGVWFLSIVSLFFTASWVGRDFQSSKELDIENSVLPVSGDTLYIRYDRSTSSDNLFLFGHDLQLKSDALSSEMIELHVVQGKSPGYKLKTSYYARGNSSEEANALASKIDYRHWVEGKTLNLSPSFEIPKGTKWRAQKVVLELEVPEGKVVIFPKDWHGNYRSHFDIDRDQEHPWNVSECAFWIMGPNGLYCPDYISSMSDTKTFTGENYTQIHIEGDLDLKIAQGDTYKVKINGRERDLEKINIRQLDDLLDISVTDRLQARPQVEITLPSLELLEADQLEFIELYGFEGSKLELWLDEVNRVKAFVKVESLRIRQTGGGGIELRGEADMLDLRLENFGELNARTFTVREAKVDVKDSNQVNLQVTELVQERVGNGSRVEIDGGAKRVSLEEAQ
ncbi:MAG: DUF2807 domain-containing protein [Saprospiraceae bacterium]|nr:DUF2807 domain-containing protein [Saprospiraceae bacterium]